MKLIPYFLKVLPNDITVITSLLGLICSILYFITSYFYFAVLAIAGLLFYLINDLFIFLKFALHFPIDTQIKASKIIYEELIIISVNIVSVIVLIKFFGEI
jgi:hypothetical protein